MRRLRGNRGAPTRRRVGLGESNKRTKHIARGHTVAVVRPWDAKAERVDAS
jgi:hypothetical protein